MKIAFGAHPDLRSNQFKDKINTAEVQAADEDPAPVGQTLIPKKQYVESQPVTKVITYNYFD